MKNKSKSVKTWTYTIARTLIWTLICLGTWSELAHAGPLGYDDGRWVFKAKESYFFSQKNYNQSGYVDSLTGDHSLTLATSTLSISHDFSDSFSLFTLADFTYGKSVSTDFERTRFAPSQMKLGTDFRLFTLFFDFIPEFMVTVPFTKVDANTDDVLISEGVFEFQGGGYLSKSFGWLSTYGYLGYTHRAQGRSSLMPYEFQLLTSIKSVQLTAGISGFTTLSNDNYVNDRPLRAAVTNRVNGGSLKYYSVNPSLAEAGFSFGTAIGDDFFGRLGVSVPYIGESTALGTTYWVSLSYSIAPPPAHGQPIDIAPKSKEQPKVKDFQPDTYKEDRYFEEAIQLKGQPHKEPSEPSTIAPQPNPTTVKLRKATKQKKKKQ